MKRTCEVCPRRCVLESGQTGFCRGRIHDGTEIVCKNYGYVTGLALDPVEKKPLRRFRPGGAILSAGSFGCNLRCPFCQNHGISMAGAGGAETIRVSPKQLAGKAAELAAMGNIGVAFTYNEPLIGWEYVCDTAHLIKKMGMAAVLVTNGYALEQTERELLPLMDAMNIDLKGFREEYYRKLGGDLETVKSFIELAVSACHVELTTLIVPGENDGEEEMEKLAGWVASVDSRIPLHITRFFPRYRMRDREPTQAEQIYRLAEIARGFLTYVYTGNC